MKRLTDWADSCACDRGNRVPVVHRVILCMLLFSAFNAWAGSNEVLAEIKLKPSSKIEKSAGIWVNGRHLGFLNELKGSKKILLLPGRHQITAKLTGYLDFDTEVDVAAGQKHVVRVAMRENLTASYPDRDEMARIKLKVKPDRAAVFVNNRYVGYVEQFRGFRKSLGLSPGTYKIHIALAGYQPFNTEITLLKQHDYVIKTKLQKGGAREQALLSNRNTSPPAEAVANER